MEVIAKVSILCRTYFLPKWQSLKLNLRARFDDVTKKGNVPLYDLRKYGTKIMDIRQIRNLGLFKNNFLLFLRALKH